MKPPMTPPPRLTVFYDGACALCRRQVAFWQRLAGEGQVNWQDISRDARPLLGTGISHRHALRHVHARTAQGQNLQGARVITALMEQAPLLRLAGKIAALPPFIWLLELLYHLSAPLRRLLAGRWGNCCGED